jgi:hypothetical protein
MNLGNLAIDNRGTGGAGGGRRTSFIDGPAYGSDGGDGGMGTGGNVTIEALGTFPTGLASTINASSLSIDASGQGGAAANGTGFNEGSRSGASGGDGGAGQGGNIRIDAQRGSTIAISANGGLTLSADGLGAGGGLAQGGLFLRGAAGGNGGSGGAGTGGSVTVTSSTGGSISQSGFTSALLSASATTGSGANGGNGSNSGLTSGSGGNGGIGGNAGLGQGGSVLLDANGGSIALVTTTLAADVTAGFAGPHGRLGHDQRPDGRGRG